MVSLRLSVAGCLTLNEITNKARGLWAVRAGLAQAGDTQGRRVEKLSIYISSFDDYADIWSPFFTRFFKYWPDCPYLVFLGAVRKTYDDSRVTTVHSDNHKNWSSRALEHLGQLTTPYVLMMLEDYMIDRPVVNDDLGKVLELMELYDLHAVRLFPDPAPEIAMPGVPILGFQAPGQLNRTNTHATIWLRESLIEIIRPGESLWEFEINGSVRSNRFAGGICGTWKPFVHYVMAIGKGRWFRRALRSLARDGIHPDLTLRPAQTRGQAFRAWLEAWAGAAIRAILPLRWRQQLQRKINPSAYRY